MIGRCRVSLLAALFAAANAQLPCSICKSGEGITIPDAMLIEGTSGFLNADMSCLEVERSGQAGLYNVFECFLLQASGAPVTCGCQAATVVVVGPTIEPNTTVAPAVTDEPSAAASIETGVPSDVLMTGKPTYSPTVVNTTDSPSTQNMLTTAPSTSPIHTADPTRSVTPSQSASDAPIALANPTTAPSGTSTFASGDIRIRSYPVDEGPISNTTKMAFELVCTTFFSNYFNSSQNVGCSVSLVSYMPMLKGNDTETEHSHSIEFLTTVMAENLNVEKVDFTSVLVTTFSNNSAVFLTTLQQSDAFYASIEVVEASQAFPVTSNDNDDNNDDHNDDKLSGGAKAGIVLAVFLGIGGIMYGAHYLRTKNPNPTQSSLEVGNPSGLGKTSSRLDLDERVYTKSDDKPIINEEDVIIVSMQSVKSLKSSGTINGGSRANVTASTRKPDPYTLAWYTFNEGEMFM